MTTTYNDIIRKRSGKAAYSIEEEKDNEWTSFIPNEQFNSVLRTVLRAVLGNDIDAHKSFWLNGTYGTGKSHAVAVITHLLCDPVEEIRTWVDDEYSAEKFKLIREQIYALREHKRLIPVKLAYLNDMSHVADLPLVLQTAVIRALSNKGIEFAVQTDFDELISHIQNNKVIWDDLISRNVALKSVASTSEKLIQKLEAKDMSSFQKAKEAQRAANMAILLSKDNIGSWLIEVQEELRSQTDYKGLLILWDEFTDVMEDSIGIQVLKALQAIAEKFANEDNDSFLFLISHPSAFNKLGNEETKQTDGRYHRMKYNMEPVSAFKIMSRKFKIIDLERHSSMCKCFYDANGQLLDIYTQSSNKPQDTREDLYNLFPIHPGTANLATHYATVVGSSSRSVFEFIGQNDQIETFLESETAFAKSETVTADYLWDFVLKVFQDDVVNYGAVTERFNTYRRHVEQHSPAATAVFKGVLLLNAFNNISGGNNNDLVTPSEENIINLFIGTQYEPEVREVLNWFNEDGVIQRAPGGIFSVQFSALPSHEIEELKTSLTNDSNKYRYISKVLTFGDTASNFFEKKYVQKNIRPYKYNFYSETNNDSILKDSIKRAKHSARTSDLYLALFFAKNNDEIAHLRQVAQESSQAAKDGDKDFSDIVFIVFDTPFGDKNYARFIEYMANYTAAQSHGFLDQVNVHCDHATGMIKDWMSSVLRGNGNIYVNGEIIPIPINHLPSTLNDVISPIIFPKGPDAVELLRTKAPNTFWKPQTSKEIIRTFIFSPTLTELSNVAGQMKPVLYLIQDVLDQNLEWRTDAPVDHPFRAVFDFIQERIKHADKTSLFNFAEKFDDLRKPPYGLSGNYASAAMVAFAMRIWANKIFDTLGKPLDQNRLVDALAELFNVWEKSKSPNKLSFKFQTPEEGKLCKSLVKVLKLDKLRDNNDISSLKDARFVITSLMLKEKGYPMWALKYMDDSFCNSHPTIILNDDLRRLFDNIVTICASSDTKNPSLFKDSLDIIDKYRADIPDIINKPGNFKNGFDNFLLQQPKVDLQHSELDSAYNYICKNLESSVGYWSEKEVIDALKDWRIAKQNTNKTEKPKNEYKQEDKEPNGKIEEGIKSHVEDISNAVPLKLKGNPDSTAKKKKDAQELIDNATREQLHAILNKVIDLDLEVIVDKILEFKENNE